MMILLRVPTMCRLPDCCLSGLSSSRHLRWTIQGNVLHERKVKPVTCRLNAEYFANQLFLGGAYTA